MAAAALAAVPGDHIVDDRGGMHGRDVESRRLRPFRILGDQVVQCLSPPASAVLAIARPNPLLAPVISQTRGVLGGPAPRVLMALSS
jgi:hypothetical protein